MTERAAINDGLPPPARPVGHEGPALQATRKCAWRVRRMCPADAPQVAHCHHDGIPTGVLAELGIRALTKLYRTLAEGQDGFVFVGVDEHDRVIGFVSGVTNLGRMYKRVLGRHALSFMLAAAKHVLSVRTIRRMLETLFYPVKTERRYPEAELLSIVVEPVAQGSGVATGLLEALLEEFRRRGVEKIKVMVRADFERANAYYRKHGFQLGGQIESHGYPCNLYVIDTGRR